MKPPRPGPNVTPQLLLRAVQTISTHAEEANALMSIANEKYYHWEELRARQHLFPSIPTEVAWAIVKMSRSPIRKLLPLSTPDTGAAGTTARPFGYSLPPHIAKMLHEVDRWGGSALTTDSAASLAPYRDPLIATSLREDEAIATSQIEGAATTRKVAKEMLRTRRSPRNTSEQMIVNSFETMQILKERQSTPLSIDLLLEIQSRMTRGTLKDASGVGRFRKDDDEVAVVDVRNDAVLYTPPPAGDLRRRMKVLVDYANEEESRAEDFVHPLVKAAVLHFWLGYEHPFVDGNGRTARALFYWFMLRQGYWLFEFLTISPAIMRKQRRYYESFLFSENDEQDMTYSLLFMLEATKDALVRLREYLSKKQHEQRTIAQKVNELTDLNRRQRALVTRVLREPDGPVSFKGHQAENEITAMTARTDILELVELGLLTSRLDGRQRIFFAAPDIDEVLARRR